MHGEQILEALVRLSGEHRGLSLAAPLFCSLLGDAGVLPPYSSVGGSSVLVPS